MHEMSVVMSLFDVITGKLHAQMGDKPCVIKKVTLQVGRLSSVVPEMLEYSFGIARKGTPFSEAVLEIREMAVTIRCRSCRKDFTLQEPAFFCPCCKSTDITITGGKELFIDTVEVE